MVTAAGCTGITGGISTCRSGATGVSGWISSGWTGMTGGTGRIFSGCTVCGSTEGVFCGCIDITADAGGTAVAAITVPCDTDCGCTGGIFTTGLDTTRGTGSIGGILAGGGVGATVGMVRLCTTRISGGGIFA